MNKEKIKAFMVGVLTVILLMFSLWYAFENQAKNVNFDRKSKLYTTLVSCEEKEIDLKEYTSFSWDCLYGFSSCELSLLEQKIKNVPSFIKEENAPLMVFMKDGRVACAVIGGEGTMNLEIEGEWECFDSKDDSVFNLKKENNGKITTIILSSH